MVVCSFVCLVDVHAARRKNDVLLSGSCIPRRVPFARGEPSLMPDILRIRRYPWTSSHDIICLWSCDSPSLFAIPRSLLESPPSLELPSDADPCRYQSYAHHRLQVVSQLRAKALRSRPHHRVCVLMASTRPVCPSPATLQDYDPVCS